MRHRWMDARRVAHPAQAIDDTVSEYYLAGEIAKIIIAIGIATPGQENASLAEAKPTATWTVTSAEGREQCSKQGLEPGSCSWS